MSKWHFWQKLPLIGAHRGNQPKKKPVFKKSTKWTTLAAQAFATAKKSLRQCFPRKDVMLKVRDIPVQLVKGSRNIKQTFLSTGVYGRKMARCLALFTMALWQYCIFKDMPLLIFAILIGYFVGVVYTATLANPLHDVEGELDMQFVAQFIGFGAFIRISMIFFVFGTVAYFHKPAFFTAVGSFFIFMGMVLWYYVGFVFDEGRKVETAKAAEKNK